MLIKLDLARWGYFFNFFNIFCYVESCFLRVFKIKILSYPVWCKFAINDKNTHLQCHYRRLFLNCQVSYCLISSVYFLYQSWKVITKARHFNLKQIWKYICWKIGLKLKYETWHLKAVFQDPSMSTYPDFIQLFQLLFKIYLDKLSF